MSWNADDQRRQQQREEQRRQQQREEQRRVDQQREQRRVEEARLRAARERDEYYAKLDATGKERRRQEAATAASDQRRRDERVRDLLAQARMDREPDANAVRATAPAGGTASVAPMPAATPTSIGEVSPSEAGSEMKQLLTQAAAAAVLAAATAGWAKYKKRRSR